VLAIVAPGQGSQTPGFLSPWIEDAQLKSTLEEFSESIGLDLVHLGTLANADEIRDTANAQPLIVSAGLLGMKSLGTINFSITAGHSVGEITSAAVAGVISDLDAMRLVHERGQAMAIAAAQSPTGMSAVLGGDRDVVIAALTALGLIGANENGAGQIVAAGKLDALAALEANPPAGSRVRPLAVAGAFHTEVMEPAVGCLRELAKGIPVNDPRVAILSNKEGSVVTTGREVLDRIVNQIANPVRWDLCMEAMKALGVTAVIELPPAGTLIGLIKRALPGVETLALKTPADLDAARDLLARQSENS
jgi:[acyl-carrier-protein] S-malonyltransferase